MPIVQWVCRTSDVMTPFAELQQNRQSVANAIASVTSSYQWNGTRIEGERSTIAYWKSDGPLQKLIRARAALVPSFRGDVERTVLSRQDAVGLARDAAIAFAANV